MTESKRGLWWWCDRWRQSSAYIDMSLAEQGAYRNLLDEQRLRGGRIPNDERTLAKACGDPMEWPNVRAAVLRHFVVSPDGKFLSNETATEVNSNSDRLSEAQAVKGRTRAESAPRKMGRFTSRTSRTTSRAPAAQPAEAPAEPPAAHQPSVAVSVSVPVSESENGNGLSGADAPRPVPLAVVPRKIGWNDEACSDWETRFGPETATKSIGVRISSQLKPLVVAHSWAVVRPVWQEFLANEGKFAAPEVFATKYAVWADPSSNRPPARASPRQTVGDLAVENAKRAIEAHRRRGDE